MINIDYFFENCAESTLLNFRYENTVAHFTVQLYENDQIISIQAATKHLYSNFSGNKAIFNPFMKNLNDCLEIKNGVYVPIADFVQLMNETRENLNLAYGLRTSQYQKFVVFEGDFTIAFVPESEVSIQIP